MARSSTTYPRKWKSRETTVIRVPERVADDLLRIARRLDESRCYGFREDGNTLVLEVVPVKRVCYTANKPINVASVPQRSPFRYPGGKTWLVVLPKNSAEAPWRIEQQRLLKDSSLRDNSTPIPPYCRRRLDEPTPAGGHRIPPRGKSRSPRTTGRQTQALYRHSASPACSQSQARRPTASWPNHHAGHSRHFAPLVPCPRRQKVDLCQVQSCRSTSRGCGAGKTRGQTAPRKSNFGGANASWEPW